MRVLRTFWSLVRRDKKLVVVVFLIGAAYYASWSFRRELGLVHPMANLRYFHFGPAPETFLDRALYWFYYPVHRPYLSCQMIHDGERYDVHWSDRRDPVLPTPAEL